MLDPFVLYERSVLCARCARVPEKVKKKIDPKQRDTG